MLMDTIMHSLKFGHGWQESYCKNPPDRSHDHWQQEKNIYGIWIQTVYQEKLMMEF